MNNKNNNGFLRNAFLYILVIIAIVTGVQYFAGGSQSPSQSLSYTQLVQELGRLVNKARKTKEEINAFLATV